MYLAIGVVIIDDIILPDGRSQMGMLGGGATHAAMGMKVWCDKVALLSTIGEDFPDNILNQMEMNFDCSGIQIRPGKTTRSWQLFEKDGTRKEVFRTSFNEMVEKIIKPEEVPESFLDIKGVFLHCMPDDIPHWRESLNKQGTPIILWEPWDSFCQARNIGVFRDLSKYVDVVSMNLEDVRNLYGLERPDEAAKKFIHDGGKHMIIRMGEKGSIIASHRGQLLSIPAVKTDNVVDVTGAGNAYGGGYLIGLSETGDLYQAGLFGAISASFALEQFGALYHTNEISVKAARRLAAIEHKKPEVLHLPVEEEHVK